MFAFTVAAALFAQGCPLRSFAVDDAVSAGGSAGTGGSSANMAGSGGSGGASGAGGRRSGVSIPRLQNDEYVVRQGSELRVDRSAGLLANDTPVNLRVTESHAVDAELPREFDARLTVEEDGAFDFVPDPRFFGEYHFSYTAKNADGDSDSAQIIVRVVPVDIELDTVLAGVGGFVIEGPASASTGSAIDRAYDVNADGLRDIVIGAPGANGGDGAVFVVFGKNDSAAVDLAREPDAMHPEFAELDAGALEALGVSVSGLGDLDGDGAGDLVLGASGGRGRAYVVLGKDVVGHVTLPLRDGYMLEGDSANTDVGRIVRGVGDVDGDTIPDVLVSSQNQDYGWIHVLFGKSSLRGRATLTSAPAFHVRAAFPDDRFPIGAAGVSDLDADGAAEVFVSSDTRFVLLKGGTSYPSDVGQLTTDGSRGGFTATRSTPGDAPVAALADINGDGVRDVGYCDDPNACHVIFGPPELLAPDWSFSGFSRRANSVIIAGGSDLDGDRLADVVLADDRAAYVVYGRRTGYSEIDLRTLGVDGYTLRAASDGAISAISVVGDVNGDGLSDLAIADAAVSDGAGRVYVVFGVRSN